MLPVGFPTCTRTLKHFQNSETLFAQKKKNLLMMYAMELLRTRVLVVLLVVTGFLSRASFPGGLPLRRHVFLSGQDVGI